jgi:molecular chaperone DnaK (HSP70)
MIVPRYCIGIDLGTSNCAVSYRDLFLSETHAQPLSIPQLLAPTLKGEKPLLPSFVYFSEQDENHFSYPEKLTRGSALVVGEGARQMAATQGDRVISSAKSWLSYSGLPRTEQILPWSSQLISAEHKLSPVAVSALCLSHIKQCWDQQFAQFSEGYRLEYQHVCITIPASFDEMAQQLTLRAAKEAGFPESTRLLEEPQAAFYAFLERHESVIETHLPQHRPLSLLACDVGGGTTDFALFSLESGGTLKRIDVGPHLLLGGDNIDLAIAYMVEREAKDRCSVHQWQHLLFQARTFKEGLVFQDPFLTDNHTTSFVIPTRGSNLFEASATITVKSKEIRDKIVEGFFPECPSTTDSETVSLQSEGLPFEKDPSITAHLSRFLKGRRIDALLLHGGTFHTPLFRERIFLALERSQGQRPWELTSSSFDFAVSQGASFYLDRVTKGKTSIVAKFPYALYLRIETKKGEANVCIVPYGVSQDTLLTLSGHTFIARCGDEVSFQLLRSRERHDDALGEILYDDSFLHVEYLPLLRTVLHSSHYEQGEKIRVTLSCMLSLNGILTLECKDTDGKETWALDFSLRAFDVPRTRLSTDALSKVDPVTLEHARNHISLYFGSRKREVPKGSVRTLPRLLEQVFGKPRSEWDIALLRGLWSLLATSVNRRGRSSEHEAVLLHLIGLSLSPGFGYPLDDLRITEAWRLFEQGLHYPKDEKNQAQWWVLWRRVGGGLSRVQHTEVFDTARCSLHSPEAIRLCGALERVDTKRKVALAETLLSSLVAPQSVASLPLASRSVALPSSDSRAATLWSLKRLLARALQYGSSDSVIPSADIENLYSRIAQVDWRSQPFRNIAEIFAVTLHSTGDRHRDLDVKFRELLSERIALVDRSLLRGQLPLQSSRPRESFDGNLLPKGLLMEI